MATLMPYSKRYGWLKGFAFAFFGMVLFDVATGKVGSWTWITAAVYGLIGASAAWYFKNRSGTALHYVIFAVIGTLVFDAITGVAMGPLLYHQPFMEALTGQIEFTLRHLAGNVIFSFIASTVIDRYLVQNPSLETARVKDILIASFART